MIGENQTLTVKAQCSRRDKLCLRVCSFQRAQRFFRMRLSDAEGDRKGQENRTENDRRRIESGTAARPLIPVEIGVTKAFIVFACGHVIHLRQILCVVRRECMCDAGKPYRGGDRRICVIAVGVFYNIAKSFVFSIGQTNNEPVVVRIHGFIICVAAVAGDLEDPCCHELYVDIGVLPARRIDRHLNGVWYRLMILDHGASNGADKEHEHDCQYGDVTLTRSKETVHLTVAIHKTSKTTISIF
ncbi:unknown [Clostridium sp. CAG:1024]|nr:unknown [Clostridium sp. CAG:1024]